MDIQRTVTKTGRIRCLIIAKIPLAVAVIASLANSATCGASNEVSFLVSEPEPRVVLTVHDCLGIGKPVRIGKLRRWWSAHHPTVNQLNNYNTIGGSISTTVQLIWYLKNWKVGAL